MEADPICEDHSDPVASFPERLETRDPRSLPRHAETRVAQASINAVYLATEVEIATRGGDAKERMASTTAADVGFIRNFGSQCGQRRGSSGSCGGHRGFSGPLA